VFDQGSRSLHIGRGLTDPKANEPGSQLTPQEGGVKPANSSLKAENSPPEPRIDIKPGPYRPIP
jgi:hypothetical protein